MWRIWWAPNNANKWQMGFNSAFKELNKVNDEFLKIGLFRLVDLTAQVICDSQQDGGR